MVLVTNSFSLENEDCNISASFGDIVNNYPPYKFSLFVTWENKFNHP
jgi:hypothetical protein